MKSDFTKIIFVLILSSRLNVSCGNKDKENAEKVLLIITNCAAILESCEGNCPPNPAIQALANCDNNCFFNWESNGFSSYFDCHLWCESQHDPSGLNDPCKKQCKEEYYECLFGPDWRNLNIKKP